MIGERRASKTADARSHAVSEPERVVSSALYGAHASPSGCERATLHGHSGVPGNPAFELHAVKRIAAGGGSNVSRVVMGTHTGTHVDAPVHFFDGSMPVDELPLDLLIGRARVVDVQHRGGIGADDLSAAGLREDIRVLLKTPNSPSGALPSFARITLSHGRARSIWSITV